MIAYSQLLERLFSHADEGYRVFQKALINCDVKIIGVRIPVLRRLAREYRENLSEFLAFSDEYYEVTFLKCTIAAQLPFERFIEAIDGVVPLLNNWAVCDSFLAPCIRKNRQAFLPYLQKYLESGREFTVRYALVTLLHDYMEKEYLPLIFRSLEQCGQQAYYVHMACAWLTAEVLVRFYREGVAFLKQGSLPKKTHNKAIQKARESFRLSIEQKEELKALRR